MCSKKAASLEQQFAFPSHVGVDQEKEGYELSQSVLFAMTSELLNKIYKPLTLSSNIIWLHLNQIWSYCLKKPFSKHIKMKLFSVQIPNYATLIRLLQIIYKITSIALLLGTLVKVFPHQARYIQINFSYLISLAQSSNLTSLPTSLLDWLIAPH